MLENCGRFTDDDLKRVWNQEEYKFHHADLLKLMINFELCYGIGRTGEYVIPELLHEKPPEQGYPDALKNWIMMKCFPASVKNAGIQKFPIFINTPP